MVAASVVVVCPGCAERDSIDALRCCVRRCLEVGGAVFTEDCLDIRQLITAEFGPTHRQRQCVTVPSSIA